MSAETALASRAASEHARQDPRRAVPVLDPDRRLRGHPDDLDDRQRVGLHQVRLAGAQRGDARLDLAERDLARRR